MIKQELKTRPIFKTPRLVINTSLNTISVVDRAGNILAQRKVKPRVSRGKGYSTVSVGSSQLRMLNMPSMGDGATRYYRYTNDLLELQRWVRSVAK